MMLAADERAFALQGPRPEIPPGWWEAYWVLVLVFLLVLGGAAWAIRALWRRRDPAPTAEQAVRQALARAGQTGTPEAALALVAALRSYLAAIEPQGAVTLSTEELDHRLRTLPVFLPARSAVLEVLRAADAAKFADMPLDPARIIEGVRESVARVETARRQFRKESA